MLHNASKNGRFGQRRDRRNIAANGFNAFPTWSTCLGGISSNGGNASYQVFHKKLLHGSLGGTYEHIGSDYQT